MDRPTRIPEPSSSIEGKNTFQAIILDKAAKRVIAPYVKTISKTKKISRKEKTDKDFPYLLAHKRPVAVLRNLSAFLSDSVDLPALFHETADVLKIVTKSSGVVLYMVNSAAGEIWQHPKNVTSVRHKVNWKIREGETIASFVAFQKEYVMTDDILGDIRFPLGVGYKGPLVKSVLCVPVVTPDDDCIAIIELYREVNEDIYTKTDLQIVVAVTAWMGAAIHQNEQRLALQKQRELNDCLLDMTKCYFAEEVHMDQIISEIVLFAKATLGAERGSFFILDPDSDELVADLFDEGLGSGSDGCLHKRKLKIRFNKERGIAGLVARTGEMVNIKDAYADSRFNKDVDMQTGFITRTILCMPIMGRDGVLGVVQLVNKENAACFTAIDESIFKTFSLYCALTLHYARLQDQMKNVDKKNDVEVEMLTYHIHPCIHDKESFLSNPELEQLPDDFQTFGWYVYGFDDILPQLVFHMFTEIASDAFIDLKTSCMFILTMKKCYRRNAYHNFHHAFNVLHCMYNILLRNSDIFTPIEKMGLMIASLGHDVDHPGVTNNFLRLVNHSMCQLYPDSTLENHHFNQTMRILVTSKLLSHLSPAVYKELVAEIHDAIIATDLAFYFRCRIKLVGILSDGEFDWTNGAQRILLKSIMMTTADLSGQCKPFSVTKRITEAVYVEFYRQGDVEKALGQNPLSMMDRDKQHLIPEDQVQFVGVVCLPCLQLLIALLPNCEEAYNNCRDIRDQWIEIVNTADKDVWKPDESYVHDDDK